MTKVDSEYLRVLEELRDKSKVTEIKSDRTGTGTTSLFGKQIRFNFDDGFPILTSKRVYFKGVKVELLWFLGNHLKEDRYKNLGRTNIRFLLDHNVHIWDEWPFQEYLEQNNLPKPDVNSTEWFTKMREFTEQIQNDDEFAIKWGTIGSGAYGSQWVAWKKYEDVISAPTTYIKDGKKRLCYNEINQIDYCLDLLKNNPDSRRIIVNSWNPSEIENCLLPPCHYSFQFYTELMTRDEREEYWMKKHGKHHSWAKNMTDKSFDRVGCPSRKISIVWNQRSADYFLGIPFNITSYSLLLSMVAKTVNMIPNEVVGNIADCHLYSNHVDQADEHLSREIDHKLPKLILQDVDSIYDFKVDDISLEEYKSDLSIKAPIAV